MKSATKLNVFGQKVLASSPRGPILHMLVAGLFYAIVHASVKFLPHIPAHEIVVARAIISIVITWIVIKKMGLSPWGINRPMLVFRGAAGTGALILYFYTLQKMPLATAVTIQYLHPILTVILAAFFLRERASWIQWLCFAASFVGVILVRGFDARIEPLHLAMGVASAVLSAIAYNLIRALRHQDHALVVMFYLPLISFIAVAPWTYFHFVTPVGVEWLILIGIGVLTQVAQYFMTLAYQADTAANISNLNYLGIFYATVIGFAIFDEKLMGLAILGIAIIVTSAVISTRFKRTKALRAPQIGS